MTRFIVDPIVNHGWHLGPSCHLMTDGTDAELVAFAAGIGLKPEWLQNPGTYKTHFDLTASKRRQAIRAGAEEVDRYGLVELLNRKRAHAIILAAPNDVLEQVLVNLKAVKP